MIPVGNRQPRNRVSGGHNQQAADGCEGGSQEGSNWPSNVSGPEPFAQRRAG
jgi:hypothetical protein